MNNEDILIFKNLDKRSTIFLVCCTKLAPITTGSQQSIEYLNIYIHNHVIIESYLNLPNK